MLEERLPDEMPLVFNGSQIFMLEQHLPDETPPGCLFWESGSQMKRQDGGRCTGFLQIGALCLYTWQWLLEATQGVKEERLHPLALR